MKALLLTQTGEPQEIIGDLDISLPREHEVLVKTAACGLCHSDLHFRQGKWKTFKLPLVLGHECSGVVEAVGSQVSYLRPGDHVVGCLTAFCGECEYCLSGRMYICTGRGLNRAETDAPRLSRRGQPVSQFVNLSGFAEMMLVHERALVKIDKSIPLDIAAVVGCAVTTGMGAVINTNEVRPGQTVAVFGCGGIGLNVIQGARIAGAAQIIAIDRFEAKARAALRFGATDAMTATPDIADRILEMTSGGVEHAFEAVGIRQVAETAFKVLRPGGTATIVGLLPQGQQIAVDSTALVFDRKLRGSNMGSNRFRIDIPRYLKMYQDGRLMLDELVSKRIELKDVDQALAGLDGDSSVTRAVAVFT